MQDWLLGAKGGTLAQDRPSEPDLGQLSMWYCTTSLWLFYPKDDRADFYASELDAFKKMLREGRTWARSIESREQVVDLLESIIQTIEAYSLSKSSAAPLAGEALALSR